MLWFIGLGISGISELSDSTLDVIKNAEIVYLESFTSPISETEKKQLEDISNGEFKTAKRWVVEDGNEILENAKNKETVLISYGDPYIATTHLELKTRAMRENIKTKTIHSSSIVSSLIGEVGLHYYKVGKVLTIMNDPKSMITPYNIIFDNLLSKTHSVILLEYNEDKSFFLDPKDALTLLLDVEKTQNRKVISEKTYAIVASRIGKDNQKIISGHISNLIGKEFGGDYASIATLLPTGKGTSASHLTATEDKFVKGEATIIEISGVHKRYHCPMARTVLLGEKNQKKIDTMKATNEALDAGISATKPGNTANDVAQKFWGVLDKYGIKKESRTGYSIGIGYPPDWGEQTLNISKGDNTVLQPNVTFHMIAVMQFGDWGVEASESVRVTEKGSELFCNLSRDLHIKG